MKKYIKIISAALVLAGGAVSAQDVALTNAKLEKPGMMQTFGKACFTLIAEDGLDVTAIPLALEVTLSKVDFDINGVEGFNSEYFAWEQDPFAANVIKGTLIDNIPNIDNDGGGAQICIPVKRSNISQYSEARNGFQVNVVPGSVEQGGNSGADETSRFGFSNALFSANNTDVIAEKEHENVSVKWEVEHYNNIESFEIKRALDGKTFKTIAFVDAVTNLLDNTQYEYIDQSISEELAQAAHYKVVSILKNGNNEDSEVRSVEFDSEFISIFPNPASDRITISTALKGDSNQLRIFNANGILISQSKNIGNGSQIEVSDFVPGIYHLEFQNNEGNKTENKRLLVIN